MELSQRARVRAGDHDEFGLLIEQGERTPISPFPVVNGKVDRDPPKEDRKSVV